jgi:hypothetical protein
MVEERNVSTRYFRATPDMRARYGTHINRYFAFLSQGDPLADAVVAAFAAMPAGRGRRMLDTALDHGIGAVPNAPAALHALFAQLDNIPFWVDWHELDTGGAAFLQSGLLGVLVIALNSLPVSYSSPAGNKALVSSGKLVQRAARRLGETGRCVYLTSLPGGLRRFSDGFKVTVKVRLMHAQVRRLLWQSGRWNATLWGAPINQCFMSATNLLLSVNLLDGMRRFGLHFSAAQRHGLMQLWRYSAYLSGVHAELLHATEQEARRFLEMVFGLDGPPDEDARALVHALMDVAHQLGLGRREWLQQMFYGISYAQIGRERARRLGYPQTPWRFLVPTARPFVRVADLLRPYIPGAQRLLQTLGVAGWRLAIDRTLAGPAPTFPFPQTLARAPSVAQAQRGGPSDDAAVLRVSQ